jgi:hypothetical protein
MTRSLRVLCCVACLLVADRADAELSITLSNKELATRSDVIVVGRAVGSSSRWVGRTLMTAVTLQVRESLKGESAGIVEVLLPGGIDVARRIPIGMAMQGAPRIQRNEEVLLFLAHDAKAGGYVVTGSAQGKFSIVSQQGRQMVARGGRGSQLAEGSILARGTTTLTPLDDLRREIAAHTAR